MRLHNLHTVFTVFQIEEESNREREKERGGWSHMGVLEGLLQYFSKAGSRTQGRLLED